MKGVIFTNFIEMVDEVFSPALTEELLDSVELPSGAAYTTVGSYDHGEILTLVTALSQMTGEEVPKLVQAFGQYLFSSLGEAHPEYIKDVPDTFSLLLQVHQHIHVEVRKLYPDAELPHIQCEARDDGMILHYRSERPFADVAEGLIAGCADHFGETISIERARDSGDGRDVEFVLTKAA